MKAKLDKEQHKKRAINRKIKKIMSDERRKKHTDAGKALEKLYVENKDNIEIQKVIDICEIYFPIPKKKPPSK